MDPILKAEWMQALRSGEFTRGVGKLRNTTIYYNYNYNTHQHQDERYVEYCCLGVLCEVAVKHDLVKWKGDDVYFGDSIGTLMLPPLMLSTLRITDEQAKKLVKLNDIERKSFLEIADYIEKNL